MIERMIDKSVLDGSFELSQHWMNPEHCDKVVITYNIDKGGNDINVSVRLLNRKEGNSLKYTYPIASLSEAPSWSAIKTRRRLFSMTSILLATFFRSGSLYDTLFVLSVKVDDPKEKKDQCQSITFKPIQVDDPSQNICKK